MGPVKQKVLLLLLGGLALGLSGSPKTYFKIIKSMREGWKEINRVSLRRAIKSLYESRLIETKSGKDGTLILVLNERGKRLALSYNLETLRLEIPKRWDSKWRIVMFDIPERLKKVRELVRFHLKNIGFLELQKSVFIHPADCSKEVLYLIELHDVRKFVRFVIAESVDNELHIKQKFGIGA